MPSGRSRRGRVSRSSTSRLRRTTQPAAGSARATRWRRNVAPGSPLWTDRSRQRHLETISLSVSAMKSAGKALDASINDLFVAGIALGMIGYHRARRHADGLSTSFVVSTRRRRHRWQLVHPNDAAARRLYRKPKPTSTMSRSAWLNGGKRSPATEHWLCRCGESVAPSVDVEFHSGHRRPARYRHVEPARCAFPTFIAGAEVERNITLGPVSGTAMNITAMSNDDVFEIGLMIDPLRWPSRACHDLSLSPMSTCSPPPTADPHSPMDIGAIFELIHPRGLLD